MPRHCLRALRWSLLVLVLSACASTHVTRVRDPDYTGRTFSAPAILAVSNDLYRRQLLEDAMAKELWNRYHIRARPSIELLPPTRDYTPDERLRILAGAGVDSLIVISGESGVTETYVPVSGATTTTSGTITPNAYGATYQSTSSTQFHGGYTVHKPWAKVTTTVMDLQTGRSAWIASSETGGNGFASFDTVRSSYCKTVTRQMRSDRILVPGPPKQISLPPAPPQDGVSFQPAMMAQGPAPDAPHVGEPAATPNAASKLEASTTQTKMPRWFVERPTPPPKKQATGPALPATRVYEIAAPSVFTVAVLRNSGKGIQLVGQGSAVAVSPMHLITNWHVAKEGDRLLIHRGKTIAPVEVYAADIERDMCWVKLLSPDIELHPVQGFRVFDSVRVGETVYSLGAPLGQENTFANGVVSGKRGQTLIQTSAPISPGSSGGGLFDVQGNLVGITRGSLEEGQALNFAVRADAFWETDRDKPKKESVKAAH